MEDLHVEPSVTAAPGPGDYADANLGTIGASPFGFWESSKRETGKGMKALHNENLTLDPGRDRARTIRPTWRVMRVRWIPLSCSQLRALARRMKLGQRCRHRALRRRSWRLDWAGVVAGGQRLRHGWSWAMGGVAATLEQAIWGPGASRTSRRLRVRAGSTDLGPKLQCGVGKLAAAATLQQAILRRRRVPVLRLSGAASGAGCDVIPVYRDLRQL